MTTQSSSTPPSQWRVLIADKLSPSVTTVFNKHNIETITRLNLAPADLSAALNEVDGVVIRSGIKITAPILKALHPHKRLKVIGRAGIGVDNIATELASEQGIVVMNTPFGNSVTTAEHTLSLLLAAARQIPAASASVHSGKWDRSAFKGTELMGKTLGVVGAGNIGALVIERALSLKMKILIYDPFLHAEQAQNLGGEKVDWTTLLKHSHAITFHVPLTPQTENMLDEAALAQTQKGVIIINCSRGGIVSEQALKTFLANGHIGAAALDVFSSEPPPSHHPLLKTPRLILTPHLGASTVEAQERVAVQIAEQISEFLHRGEVRHAVNTFSLTAKEYLHSKPYLKLTTALASFIGNMIAAPVKALAITVEGAATTIKEEALTATALYHLFKKSIAAINPINAITTIQTRGIHYNFVKSDHPSLYHSLIDLSVETEKYHYHISGTTIGQRAYITKMQNSAIGAEIKHHHLYVINEDKPGFISALSHLLAKHNINIIAFHLAAADSQDHATPPASAQTAAALITLNSALDAQLLQAIQALPLLIKATYVEL